MYRFPRGFRSFGRCLELGPDRRGLEELDRIFVTEVPATPIVAKSPKTKKPARVGRLASENPLVGRGLRTYLL